MSSDEYKFPKIYEKRQHNLQAGWTHDACDYLENSDVDTAKVMQILKKGTKQQIDSFFKKQQREIELINRVHRRNQLQQEHEEWKRKQDRETKLFIEGLVREAATKSKQLVKVDKAFKRDNLNQFRRYSSDKHDGVLK